MSTLVDTKPCPEIVPVLLEKLLSSGALSRSQAERLGRAWPAIHGDDFAHPLLRTIGEHTRAILEREAEICRGG